MDKVEDEVDGRRRMDLRSVGDGAGTRRGGAATNEDRRWRIETGLCSAGTKSLRELCAF